MDLVTLNNQIGSLDSNDFKSLLPKPQTNRSYQDVETDKKLIVSIEKFQYGEKSGKMIFQTQIMWAPFDPQQQTATQEQLNQLAKDWLNTNSNIGLKDSKTVKITSVNKKYITYEWDIETWLDDNFKNVKPSFTLPDTFSFKYKYSIPTFVQSRIQEVELNKFIVKKFEEWLNKNNRMKLIKNNNFNFVSKLVPQLFQYSMNYQTSEIRMSLKQSVVLAGLVGALMYNNKDKFTKKEKEDIEKKINTIGSVKKVGKYIKKL